MCLWVTPVICHPSDSCSWEEDGSSDWASGQELSSITVLAAFSIMVCCVGADIFWSGWKIMPLISGTMESFFEMQKVPNKVGFLSLAAAAPQTFPGSHVSSVTSLLASLLAVQFSAAGFKGEMLVPPFATTASSAQDRTVFSSHPCNVLSHATKSCNPCTKGSVVLARNHP